MDLTLVLIIKEGRVLLGMKKRGFGEGRWNGFGGKVKHGESVEQAAQRELLEEAGIGTDTLIKRGEFTFTFEDDSEALRCHLFSADTYSGVPKETEEMKPQWFSFDQIPYDTMWPDDRYWLPAVLAGKNIKAVFHFKDTNTLLSHDVQETNNF